jgi:hypothetical protein
MLTEGTVRNDAGIVEPAPYAIPVYPRMDSEFSVAINPSLRRNLATINQERIRTSSPDDPMHAPYFVPKTENEIPISQQNLYYPTYSDQSYKQLLFEPYRLQQYMQQSQFRQQQQLQAHQIQKMQQMQSFRILQPNYQEGQNPQSFQPTLLHPGNFPASILSEMELNGMLYNPTEPLLTPFMEESQVPLGLHYDHSVQIPNQDHKMSFSNDGNTPPELIDEPNLRSNLSLLSSIKEEPLN